MRRLTNDPTAFADEAARGFASAHSDVVVSVVGGLVSARVPPAPAVAVVVGGGSGHYPAFAGYVGPGMASGAALGNVFASPSTRQIEAVARSADEGRGVLFVYGNYAGDVLNFDDAQARISSTGIAAATVRVTDDVSSGPATVTDRRRGVAGDLVVIKVAGAAAWSGMSLAGVADAAARANASTRTLGVAFGGCTLPGADQPLFEIPEGVMAVGMGIHGEPGVREVAALDAEGLGELLVTSLLTERPAEAEGRPVVALLNGLGATKSEELFVLWAAVERELESAGVEVASVEVGEFVTSFDMAGVSLTLSWLAPDLLDLWLAPAAAPAFRRGAVGDSRERATGSPPDDTAAAAANSDAAQVDPAASAVAAIAMVVDERVASIEELLGRLDAVAGDGDHGIGMRRGTFAAASAARGAARAGLSAAETLAAAADAWGDKAGGTSGALWATGLSQLARGMRESGADSCEQFAEIVAIAAATIPSKGGARPGDKTMVDALDPYVATFAREAPRGAAAALRAAAAAADEAARATAMMKPGLGRARTHESRSLGSPDPGAVSFAAIADAIADWWEAHT
ncbi:dihydroxyacetone kinase family protein [Microbacterium sp. SSM24]|uniref:dihydroxyacetone kinase family protein n=1 Tax=Microbacterium sp. SSM24 TaxID=2991714 RepID=UPI002227E6B4|nr:dihydroxyacetone kinase family protein [Microbacterium sp. SSM24]MCW3492638.1 dihydroxyacetone kinase family protein [Microbacterium sp. SSM24]